MCVFVIVVVVVVMIVLVVVVDGSGSGCDSVGGYVLFSFISYVFKSSVYFKQCYMSIDKKQQQKTTQKRLISYASTPHTVLLFKERQCGASLVPIALGIL